MADSPKTQVLQILESKWDTLAFANPAITTRQMHFQYRSNGVAWWCIAPFDGVAQLQDFDYDTSEDWPHWAEILEELQTLEA